MSYKERNDMYKKKEEEKIKKYNNKMINKMINYKKSIQKAIALIEMEIEIEKIHKLNEEEITIAKELLELYRKNKISDFELDETKTKEEFKELKRRKNIK
jgi:hypothetical protein